MRYETVLEKNRKITLSRDVIRELGLEENDEVVIITVYMDKRGYYAYLCSKKSELLDVLLSDSRKKPIAK